MTMIYQVNEVFNSIQGEGVHAGKPATFIRLQGCTVGCSWCDTKYTWKQGGFQRKAMDIVADLGRDIRPHVVITGGEPTLYDLDDLLIAISTKCEQFYDSTYMIQLETSGQNKLKGTLEPSWVTWSPKRNLRYQCHPSIMRVVNEIKFVVDTELELDTIRRVVGGFEKETKRSVPVILMPEGTPPSTINVFACLNYLAEEPTYRFGDRLHYRLNLK